MRTTGPQDAMVRPFPTAQVLPQSPNPGALASPPLPYGSLVGSSARGPGRPPSFPTGRSPNEGPVSTAGAAGQQHRRCQHPQDSLFLSSASRVLFRDELEEVLCPLAWAGSQGGCAFGRKQKPRSEETTDQKGSQRGERLTRCRPLLRPKAHTPPRPDKAGTNS